MCRSVLCIFIIFALKVNSKTIYFDPLAKIKVENFTVNLHLRFEHIKNICVNRDKICRSDMTNVCTMRLKDNETEYKDFVNSCYLFLSNMCDNPGNEHHIVSSSNCTDYRNERKFAIDLRKLGVKGKSTTTPKSLYKIDQAFDDHVCPLSCPNVYSPVCLLANRGVGKYFKFFTFMNHCLGDIYYCQHYDEFAPPPNSDGEDVASSFLGWSFCGHYKYLQFARFAEVASSMGHYGWLAGDSRYTHIEEPNQRLPGYGK